jgi:hypothetical protein
MYRLENSTRPLSLIRPHLEACLLALSRLQQVLTAEQTDLSLRQQKALSDWARTVESAQPGRRGDYRRDSQLRNN